MRETGKFKHAVCGSRFRLGGDHILQSGMILSSGAGYTAGPIGPRFVSSLLMIDQQSIAGSGAEELLICISRHCCRH